MARGGLKEIISALSLCAALVITIEFTMPLFKFINTSPLINDVITSNFFQNFMKSIEMPPLTEDMIIRLNYCLSLLLCFVGAFSICEAVLSYSSLIEAFGLPATLANRKLGGALGVVRGFVLVLIFIIVLDKIYHDDVPASKFVNLLQGSATKMNDIVISGAPQRYLEILQDKNLYNQENVMKDLLEPT